MQRLRAIIPRMHLQDIAVGTIEPSEQKQRVARSNAAECLLDRRLKNQNGQGRAFFALLGSVRQASQR
jgi:hypothetical protein